MDSLPGWPIPTAPSCPHCRSRPSRWPTHAVLGHDDFIEEVLLGERRRLPNRMVNVPPEDAAANDCVVEPRPAAIESMSSQTVIWYGFVLRAVRAVCESVRMSR